MRPRDRTTAIVWRGAGCLATTAPHAFAETAGDLVQVRAALQPWQQLERFLVDDRGPRHDVPSLAAVDGA